MDIGPAGGTVSLEGLTLTIPPGALTQTTTITVTSSQDNVPWLQQYSPLYFLEPDGLDFLKPATVTITSPDKLSTDVMLLSTVHAGGPSVTWMQDRHGSATQQSLTASINHFSDVIDANLAPCDAQQDIECSYLPCGRHVRQVGVAGGSNPSQSEKYERNASRVFLDQCVLDCPCQEVNPLAGADLTIATFDNGSNSFSLDSMACSTSESIYDDIPSDLVNDIDATLENRAVIDGISLSVDDSQATLSDATTGEALYRASLPLGTNLPFGYDFTIPTVTMTGTDPAKYTATFTLGGPVGCPGTVIPRAPSDAGTGLVDAASHDGGAHDATAQDGPTLTPDVGACPGFSRVTSVTPLTGPLGTQVTVTGCGMTGATGVTLAYCMGGISGFGPPPETLPVTVVSDSEVQFYANPSMALNFAPAVNVAGSSFLRPGWPMYSFPPSITAAGATPTCGPYDTNCCGATATCCQPSGIVLRNPTSSTGFGCDATNDCYGWVFGQNLATNNSPQGSQGSPTFPPVTVSLNGVASLSINQPSATCTEVAGQWHAGAYQVGALNTISVSTPAGTASATCIGSGMTVAAPFTDCNKCCTTTGCYDTSIGVGSNCCPTLNPSGGCNYTSTSCSCT
jgi:hypothetical protein